MNRERFQSITNRYLKLRIAVLGDYCLDRYLEIDPSKQETSIETGLPVHNVVNVRPQPGGAGTIVNNLAALGIREILPIGFAGEDGEGSELRAALEKVPGVRLDSFVKTRERRTFTYCKPLIVEKGKPPVELNRLDSKNWTTTPAAVEEALIRGLDHVSGSVDAIIILDQVDKPDTGVVTGRVLEAVGQFAAKHPQVHVLADSRRGLSGYPAVIFKMNSSELAALTGAREPYDIESAGKAALGLARKNGRPVFISLAAQGLLGVDADGTTCHLPALPLRGEIDVVGAGDAVSANLATALAAGASLAEALELANTAASIVIHKLGTTGTANVNEIASLLGY